MISEHEHNEETDVEFEEEATFEELDAEGEETRATDKISSLRKKLHDSEQARRTLAEDMQRAKADFLNARRRLTEEQERNKDRIRMNFIEELLPLCDSFYMAMSNKDAWNAVDSVWRTGVESIHAQLNAILLNHNVTIINPTGATFDPQKHEAVSNAPVAESTLHDTVIAVLQPGYEMKVGDRSEIIRPARVVVGNYTEA